MKNAKIFFLGLIVCAFTLGLFGCAQQIAPNTIPPDANADTRSTAPEAQKNEETYKALHDEYTKKLKEATPGLIDQFHAEAEHNEEGIEGLANISNAKIALLAEISSEGMTAMAQVMYSSGTSSDPESFIEYETWAGKLQTVYMEEVSKITDAYLSSAY
jgi:hypothetical protein